MPLHRPEINSIATCMKPQLIVALDVPSATEICPVVEALGDLVSFYKVGLELFTAEGPASLAPLQERNKNIFLDLKLHDIPRTVARAVKSASHHGIDLLTLHAGGGKDMLAEAAEAAAEIRDRPLKLLAITVLTSLNDNDLAEMGFQGSVPNCAARLGQMAFEAGIDGLVCSPHEVSHFREQLGTDPIIVTPGVRPANAGPGDQKRVATPAMAVRAGADYLVVGRPILESADPPAAARLILDDMELGLCPSYKG